jgi:predicted MFS family arabinose efflux permease
MPYLVTGYGWECAATYVGVSGVIIVLILLPTVSWNNGFQAKAPARFRPLDPVRYLLAIPGMTRILVAILIYTGIQLCLRSLITAYMVKDIGFGLGAAGLALSVSQAAGMLGQVTWAWLSDRLMTPRTVMAGVGAVISVGALATAAFSIEWPAFAIMGVAAILGFSAAGFVPVILGEVARHSPPGQVGALTSGANLFIITGAFFGPLIFGGVGSILSYRAAFVALGMGAAITAMGLLTTRKAAEAS